MMNDNLLTMYFMANCCQIAATISDNYMVSDHLPFSGIVKHLIEDSIKSECFFSYFTIKSKVLEPLLESWDRYQF